jgi:hypothetical protein
MISFREQSIERKKEIYNKRNGLLELRMKRFYLWGVNTTYPLASHRSGPGSRPSLASGICGGQSGVKAAFLRELRFPLPKPFIPPTSPSSQSPGEVSRGLATIWSPVQGPANCPRSSNWNETESFMEVANAQNWAVEPQGKRILRIRSKILYMRPDVPFTFTV